MICFQITEICFQQSPGVRFAITLWNVQVSDLQSQPEGSRCQICNHTLEGPGIRSAISLQSAKEFKAELAIPSLHVMSVWQTFDESITISDQQDWWYTVPTWYPSTVTSGINCPIGLCYDSVHLPCPMRFFSLIGQDFFIWALIIWFLLVYVRFLKKMV